MGSTIQTEQTKGTLGAGIAQWLERQARDRKVPGSNPGRSDGRIFLSRVNSLCWLLFRYPFHPRVTTIAGKRSRSFCHKCRWQVTAKHTYTLPMWLSMKWHCKLVHSWMVYTEPACTSYATTKDRYQYTASVDINNTHYKRIVTHSESHATCAQWVFSRAENSAI